MDVVQLESICQSRTQGGSDPANLLVALARQPAQNAVLGGKCDNDRDLRHCNVARTLRLRKEVASVKGRKQDKAQVATVTMCEQYPRSR